MDDHRRCHGFSADWSSVHNPYTYRDLQDHSLITFIEESECRKVKIMNRH